MFALPASPIHTQARGERARGAALACQDPDMPAKSVRYPGNTGQYAAFSPAATALFDLAGKMPIPGIKRTRVAVIARTPYNLALDPYGHHCRRPRPNKNNPKRKLLNLREHLES